MHVHNNAVIMHQHNVAVTTCVHFSRCLEVIINEQVEKLTASLRSIRSVTSHARSKALKLTQLSQVHNIIARGRIYMQKMF